MGNRNRIEFDSSFSSVESLLSRQDVIDLIGMFYTGPGASWKIESFSKPGIRGEHVKDPFGAHFIRLSKKEIYDCYVAGKAVGGNRKALSSKMAAAMVMVHEIQHANQSVRHTNDESSFYGGRRSKYFRRPCEREARAFVDDHYEMIAEFSGVRLLSVPSLFHEGPEDEVSSVAESFEECEEVTVADIVEELRASGENNAKNVERVVSILKDKGVRVAV